jgi:DNA-binding NarL/FixJ family response regulator
MRFLLIDDHPLMRAGVHSVLRNHWVGTEIVEAETLAAAVNGLAQGVPFDLVLLDLSLPDCAGLEGLITLRRRLPQTPILVLTMHGESTYAEHALKAGANGFLPKDQAGQELIHAVDRLLAGGRYLTRELNEKLAQKHLDGDARAPHERLSPQEYRVMLQLSAGHSVGEIAETMHLSVKTVSTYRGHILEKLALANNAEITRYCLANGLLKTIL